MRFKPRFAAQAIEAAARLVERPAGVVEILAPRSWTSCQIESWLDGAAGAAASPLLAGLPEALAADAPPDALLDGALFDHAQRLTAAGWTAGLFDSLEDALAFRDDLIASMAAGLAAPGSAGAELPDPPLDLDSPAFAARLAERAAAKRAGRTAAEAARALGAKLQAVMDAVLRCEGDPAACADPRHNAALGRAAPRRARSRRLRRPDRRGYRARPRRRGGLAERAGRAGPRPRRR
ncbi:MAG: hypothetical protein WDM92_01480 [Caulobacteraceae bacterium]